MGKLNDVFGIEIRVYEGFRNWILSEEESGV